MKVTTASVLPFFALAVVLLMLPVASFAEELVVSSADEADAELADPGMLPDSPFYMFKTFGENVRMVFTFNEKDRIMLRMQFAETRLAEAEQMQLRNRTQLAEQLMERYQEHVQAAEQERERLRLRNITLDDVDEYMNRTTSKHIYVLTRVLENAPEPARAGIQNALENAEEHQDAVRTRLVEWATSSGKNVTTVIRNKTVSTQCTAAADCESLPHIAIVGHWQCEAGRCRYAANESARSPAASTGAGTQAATRAGANK